jgi:hypothetical protein
MLRMRVEVYILEVVSHTISGSVVFSLSFHIIATSQARVPKPLFEGVQLLCKEQPLVPWISLIATVSRLRGMRARSASLRCAHIIHDNLRLLATR